MLVGAGGGKTEQAESTDLRGVIGEPTSGKLVRPDSGLWTGFLAPKYPPAASSSWLGFGQTGGYRLTAADPPADKAVNQYTSTPFDSREYDLRGNLVKITLPGGGTRSMEYDYRNMMTKFTDESGKVTRYEYDAFLRRARKIEDAGGLGAGRNALPAQGMAGDRGAGRAAVEGGGPTKLTTDGRRGSWVRCVRGASCSRGEDAHATGDDGRRGRWFHTMYYLWVDGGGGLGAEGLLHAPVPVR